MAQSSVLREKQRQTTRQLISDATQRLASEHGLSALTTEMIAAEAGVSLRTFFNYFPNKEAAFAGGLPKAESQLLTDLATGHRPLWEDVETLLTNHLVSLAPDKERTREIMRLARDSPRVAFNHLETLRFMQEEVAEALQRRLPDMPASQIELTSDIIILALRKTVGCWVEDEKLSEKDAASQTLSLLKVTLTHMFAWGERDHVDTKS